MFLNAVSGSYSPFEKYLRSRFHLSSWSSRHVCPEVITTLTLNEFRLAAKEACPSPSKSQASSKRWIGPGDFFLDTHHGPSVGLRIRISEEHSPPRMQMQHPLARGSTVIAFPIRFVRSSPGPFVSKMGSAAGDNLRSIVLYGSAATGEFHPDFSNVNLLCVLHETSFATLSAIAPVVKWWTDKKHHSRLSSPATN